MVTHEGHFVGVAQAHCPVCHGGAELTQLVNDTSNQIVSQFTVCPRCGTFPVAEYSSGHVSWSENWPKDWDMV